MKPELNQVNDVTLGRISPFDNPARIANDDRVTRNVLIDKRVRRNENVIADGNVARNCGVDSQIDAVTYRGNTLSFSTVFLADGAPLVNIDITPQLSAHVDRDSIGMADVESLANLS